MIGEALSALLRQYVDPLPPKSPDPAWHLDRLALRKALNVSRETSRDELADRRRSR